MTVEQQNYLVALANLSAKILINDSTVMDDVATINSFIDSIIASPVDEINATDLENQLEDTLMQQISAITESTKDLFKQVVAGLTHLSDTVFMVKLIDFQALNLADKKAVKAFITSTLAETTTYPAPKDFIIYQRLVNLAILTRDASIIKATIEKVQSL